MPEEPKHIEIMAKHLVIISIKFNPAILIFTFSTKEKQQELFDAIKATGTMQQSNGSIPIAAAYKATIEEEYKAKMQIVQPIGINLN
jgi:hypothetical protein